MSLPPRLIIADPGLRSALGHHLGYTLAVAEAARERGIAPLVLASKQFSGAMPTGIPCLPTFGAVYQSAGGGGAARRAVFGLAARLPGGLAASVAPPLRLLRRVLVRPAPDTLAAELATALVANGDTRQDLLLLHSASAANLAGMVAGLPPECLGALAIVLRRTPVEMDRDDAGAQPVAAILAGIADRFGPKLRLLADTAPLAALWTATSGRPVRVAPLPVVAPPVRTGGPGRPPHLVFAGGARAEKGYALLPALVASLVGQARFTIHSGPVGTAADPVVQRAQRQMRGIAGAQLHLLETPLPPEDYLNLLQAADLLLLPYDSAAYGPRSSGILAEARAMGVPAVVPAGCWMADEVGPDHSLVFHRPAEFARVVRDALPRLPALLTQYATAAPAWRIRHSPAGLLAELLR